MHAIGYDGQGLDRIPPPADDVLGVDHPAVLGVLQSGLDDIR